MYEGDFREKLRQYLDNMDWVQIEGISNWLVEKFGKGKNSSIVHHTSYVQLYEECVDRIQADYKICLISVLLNTPAMPMSGDASVAFIQQWVAMVEIVRQFFSSFFLIQFNVPFKIISLIETSHSVGGAEREYPG